MNVELVFDGASGHGHDRGMRFFDGAVSIRWARRTEGLSRSMWKIVAYPNRL
jgi:hypothetical protein